MSDFKSGFVTVIGRPNVGKSTLINQIVGEKIAITSPRPQTTRNKMRLVYTTEKGQIIFVDTPGMHKIKNELDDYMLDQIYDSLKGIDVIIFVVDATTPFGKGDDYVYKEIKGTDIPVIIAMNKIDKINKKTLMSRKENYERATGKEVIPVAATQKKNFDTLIDTVFSCLPEGPKYYPEDMITDQIERFVVSEIIREKLFYFTRDEVPYGIAVLIEDMKQRNDDMFYIRANIFVEKKSHKGIVIGKNGKRLKKIGEKARSDLEGFLQSKVYLDLWVKVRQDWRNKDYLVERMGYNKG
ncbi:MAG: GTPase Era [Bacillota bacterium]